MRFPHSRGQDRPGRTFPVFFFVVGPVLFLSGQLPGQIRGLEGSDAQVLAIAGIYSARITQANAMYNQAALAALEQPVLSLNHSRPFLLKELGLTTLSFQGPVGNGGLGCSFTNVGVEGFRYYSFWFSTGLTLHPGVQAGLGLHFWAWGGSGILIGNPGISCAMGIRFRVNDRLVVGAHIRHPFSWDSGTATNRVVRMSSTLGLSYALTTGLEWYGELQTDAENRIHGCQGVSYRVHPSLSVMCGMRTGPFSLSGGTTLTRSAWKFTFSFNCIHATGIHPASTIAFGW